MAITLHYRLDDKQNLAVRAETQITYEKDKIYRLVLIILKKDDKNPVLMNDVLLQNGMGSAEVSYDYSLFNSKGVNLTLHAHVCILPDPPPPESTAPEQDITGNTPKPIIVEEQTDDIHLFGTADCLDNIRLEQTQSFLCPAIGPLPAPQARFLIQVQLKEDYTLLRFYKDSVSLTCLTKEGQKNAKL